MMRSLFKNSFFPKQSPYGCNGIREGRFCFGIPLRPSYSDTMTPRMLSKNQAHYAEQAQQTRGCTQHRLGYILSWRFKTQVCTQLLKRGLYGPAGREPTGDLGGSKARNGSVEVLIPMCALNIVDKDPTNRTKPPPALYHCPVSLVN